MDIYAGLFESMLDCCSRGWLRRGPVYTLAMLALGLGACLNLLSIIDLLWTLGVLSNPYQNDGALHPQRYLYALLCSVFLANIVLARLKFSADRRSQHTVRATTVSAPVYVLVSMGLFLLTLTIELRNLA